MRTYLSALPLLVLPTASLGLGSLTSRAESDLPPRPDGDGFCYKYAVQETDTCQSIADAHKISPADIESYNTPVWHWPGCANVNQGDFLCLSTGKPVMPVALAQAVCGPQVPGTKRPDDYALLSTLNPCPENQCCTTEGICVPTDTCPRDNCISGCEASPPAPVQVPAEPESEPEPEPEPKPEQQEPTNVQTKPNPPLKPTTTTTNAKPPQKTTTKINPPAKTTPESPSWTLAAYTWLNCDANYLVIVGHKEDDGKCIDIHGGLSPDLSTTGVSCRYYWDGGLNSSDCDSSPSLGIHSWSLTGAKCTAFKKGCEDSGRERVKIEPAVGCQVNRERRPHYYMHWGSVRCESV